MDEYITITELKKDGRVIIDRNTRKAGNMEPGDLLQLKVSMIKKAKKEK